LKEDSRAVRGDEGEAGVDYRRWRLRGCGGDESGAD
jgi:hypothetical protein